MSLILILAPDEASVEALRCALDAAGQTVQVVAGDAALDSSLRVNQAKPDVLAIHARVPGAAAACERLLSSHTTRYLPIVALTSERAAADVVDGFLAAGAHDVIELDGPVGLQVARIDNMARVNHLRRTYRRLNDAVTVHRAEFETLFDASPVGVVVASSNGSVLRTNPSARALLGGHSLYDLRPVEPPEGASKHPLVAAATGGERAPARRYTVRGRDADRPDRVVVVEGFPLRVAGDLPVGGIALVTNDGEGVDLTLALREASRSLSRQTDDMERFVATASHDMKNPLNTIQRYVELAVDRSDATDEEVDGWLGRIDVNAHRLRHLIDGLLGVVRSRGVMLRRELVPLSDVVADALRVQRAQIEENGVVVRVDEPLPTASVDFDVFVQILENLVSNAIKYRAPEGPCRVRIGTAEIEPGQTYLYVQDNGLGIEASHHSEIFEPFLRLHRKDVIQGSGLGLAIAHQLVERHGGRIWVTSTLGQGSTFHIMVPETAG